jgi:predicted component of type VI protein secretion system
MTRLAFLIVSTAILLPTAAMAQSAAPASGQASPNAQTGTASASQNSAATAQKCAAAKAAQAREQHDPSALPGKDTGWVPPPRKRPPLPAECSTQPH